MKLFRRKKKAAPIDLFDRSLRHYGGDIPEDLKEYLIERYFVLPIFRKAWPHAAPEYDFGDASVVRLEANGEMHTRVIVCNNGGGAEDAIDIDGRMGELLWILCRNREKEEE